MDYVLYTPNARYWDMQLADYGPPSVEWVLFKDADKTVALEEIFGVNDTMQGLCFWLGADAEDV